MTRKNYRVTVEVVEWEANERSYGYFEVPTGSYHPAGTNDFKQVYQQSFTSLDVRQLANWLNQEPKQ